MSNYDSNPYYGGGGGGGGGGGFMQGGSPFGSQDSPGGNKKKSSTTIRPVTVKQLLEASQVHPDSDFSIDGLDVGQILMVGSVRNQSTSATNVQYEIGDGTGYIDVRLWLDSADDEAGKMNGIEQDRYVAIMGTMKTFGGKRHLSATHMRAITDHNEVFNHFLKCVWVSLSIRNPGGNAGGGGGGAAHADYSAGTHAAPANGHDSSAWAHLPPLQRRIMEIIIKEESDDGMHVAMVGKQLGSNSDDVMEAIENLMSEGMLFSTIDDVHVKAI